MSRKIDALIAEHVFNKEVMVTEFWNKYNNEHREEFDCPNYSTQIQDAWLVVEKMKEQKHYVDFSLADSVTEDMAMCDDYNAKYYSSFCIGRGNEAASADTPSMAICLAALKALGVAIPLETLNDEQRSGE